MKACRIALVTCLVVVASTLGATTAQSAVVAGARFHGWMAIWPHICLPLAPGCGGPGKKGPGATLGFVAGAGEKKPDPKGILSACIGHAVSGKKGSTSGPLCDINMAGTIFNTSLGTGPWCGEADILMSGTIRFSKQKVIDFSAIGRWRGPLLIILGGEAWKGSQTGTFGADPWLLQPDPTNSSCTNKIGPDHFRWDGTFFTTISGTK